MTKSTTLRISEEAYEKMRHLAFLDRLSVNAEIVKVLDGYIREVERLNGELCLPEKNNPVKG